MNIELPWFVYVISICIRLVLIPIPLIFDGIERYISVSIDAALLGFIMFYVFKLTLMNKWNWYSFISGSCILLNICVFL